MLAFGPAVFSSNLSNVSDMKAKAYPICCAVLALLTSITDASAQVFTGKSLTVRNLFQGTESPGYTATFTVDSTPGVVEVPDWGGAGKFSLDAFDIDATHARILVTSLSGGTFGASPNLIGFSDDGGAISTFAGATLVSTTFPGVTGALVSFTDNSVSLDIGGLTQSGGETVTIGITAVPEPAAQAVVVGVAAGLFAFLRPRRHAASAI